MKNEIIIQQALHGYDNGHALIASSIDINPDSKRLLLVMSDMSGPSMQSGFEEYVTGYPLKDINYFALAKTWYAPEMKRPGCVWTHTLLIQFADLARISDVQQLKGLFKKPVFEHEYSFYKEPVSFESVRVENSLPFIIDNNFLRELFELLYINVNSSIFIRSSKPKFYEELLFYLWNQQWPRLRRNFSFCSGAISPRQFQKNYLDLQVVPFSFQIDSNKQLSRIAILKEEPTLKEDKVEWLEAIIEDFYRPSILRLFCRKFGGDVHASRNSFKPLVEIFLFFQRESNYTLEQALSKIAILFPKKTDATTLKVALLSSKAIDVEFRIPVYGEEEVFLALATTEHYKSFDLEKIHLDERFEDFFLKNRTSAFNLMDRLIRYNVNVIGEKLLKKIASTTEDNDFVSIKSNQRELILVLESLNPKFCYKKDFWIKNKDSQREIVSSLIRSQKASVNWQAIINILIEIDSNIDLEYLHSNIEVSKYILNWVCQHDNGELGYRWVNFLRHQPKEIIFWLQSNESFNRHSLELIISLLNPNSYDVVNTDSNLWMRLLNEFSNLNLNKPVIDLKAFVLAISFNNPIKKSYMLMKETFDPVYEALKHNGLDYSAWRHIEIHTPQLNFWNDWDKCKKLSKAIAEKFVKENCSFKTLNEISRIPEIKKRLETEYKKLDR